MKTGKYPGLLGRPEWFIASGHPPMPKKNGYFGWRVRRSDTSTTPERPCSCCMGCSSGRMASLAPLWWGHLRFFAVPTARFCTRCIQIQIICSRCDSDFPSIMHAMSRCDSVLVSCSAVRVQATLPPPSIRRSLNMRSQRPATAPAGTIEATSPRPVSWPSKVIRSFLLYLFHPFATFSLTQYHQSKTPCAWFGFEVFQDQRRSHCLWVWKSWGWDGGQELWGVHRYFARVLCFVGIFVALNLNNKTLMSTKSRSKDFSVSLFQLGESLATLAAWAWETQSVNQVHVTMSRVSVFVAFLERPVWNCLAGCVRCSRYSGWDNWEFGCPTSWRCLKNTCLGMMPSSTLPG